MLRFRCTALDLAVLQALADIRLARRPDGKIVAADPSEAVPQCYALFALEMARRESAEAPAGVDPDVCWHCADVLEPAPRHCERCPPEGQCDAGADGACDEPGCADARDEGGPRDTTGPT